MEKRGPIRGYRDTGYLGKKMIGIRDIWAKNLRDTGCLKKVLGYRRSNFSFFKRIK